MPHSSLGATRERTYRRQGEVEGVVLRENFGWDNTGNAGLRGASANMFKIPSHRAGIRAWLTATDWTKNDADPCGDGDQSPLQTVDARNVHRVCWAEGADALGVIQCALEVYARKTRGKEGPTASLEASELWVACYTGDLVNVKAMLEREMGTDERAEMIERRVTCMRVTPLMTAIDGSRRKGGLSAPERTGVGTRPLDHKEIVRLLLASGARVDALNFVGKNVVHIGAGKLATKETLEMVEMCVEKHEETRAEGDIRLVNVQDRLGSVAIHEVVVNNRVDAAKVLLRLQADPTLKDADGIDAMKMLSPFLNPDVTHVISTHMARRHRVLTKGVCNFCKREAGEREKSFKACSRCWKARYCSRCVTRRWG